MKPETEQPRRVFQFSLRTLLLVMAAFFVWLGFQSNRAHRQREAVEAIERLGGSVQYDNIYAEPPGQNRTPLERWLGPDFTRRVVAVYLSGTKTDDNDLLLFRDLPDVEGVALISTRVTDRGLARLYDLSRLKYVDVRFSQVTPEGVAALRRALPKAEVHGLSDLE